MLILIIISTMNFSDDFSLAHFSILCLFQLLFIFQNCLSVTVSPNHIRICSKSGESVDLDNSFCSRGWWLPKPIEPECICVGGSWLISENYCDPNFYLLTGPTFDDKSGQEYTCFKVDSPVRRIASLTKPTKAYTHYIIEADGKYMAQMDSSDFSPEPKSPITIIRLNSRTEMYLLHREGVQDNTWQKCTGKKQTTPYTQIIKVDSTVSFLKSMTDEEACDDVKDADFPFSRTNDSDWILDKAGSIGWNPTKSLMPINSCSCSAPGGPSSQPITPKPEIVRKRKGKPAAPTNNDRDRNTDPDYDSVPGDAFNIYPKNRDPLLHAEHLSDNRRTTASILSKLKDFIMLGIKPPPFSNPLFEYIRYGKKILTKFCPEINSRILGNLVGLFRLLLSDIIGRYPEEYSLNVDTGVHRRVLQALGACFQGMSNRTVKFFWGKSEELAHDCKKRKRILSLEVDGTSLPIPRGTGKSGMPPRLKFIDGDIMLEVAWKVLMGAHYACSEYFIDYPEDLSFMYVKGQEFLTIPYVMFRWENPARGLTAAYKILNPDLDVHVLSEQIDACVFAAFDSSTYNSWMGRPESEKEFIPNAVLKTAQNKLSGKSDLDVFSTKTNSNKKNRLEGRVIDGKGAFCLADFNDPIQWSQADESFAEITGC